MKRERNSSLITLKLLLEKTTLRFGFDAIFLQLLGFANANQNTET